MVFRPKQPSQRLALNNQEGFSVFEAILIIVVLGLVAIGALRFASYHKQTQVSIEASQKNADSLVSQNYPRPSKGTINNAAKTGFIQGRLSFPATPLPDMAVCAQELSEPKVKICYDKPNSGENYGIRVPVGRYYVYAQLLKAQSELSAGAKAYFNEYVICGQKSSCPEIGHTQPKIVTVDESKTTTGVDPIDWYTTQ